MTEEKNTNTESVEVKEQVKPEAVATTESVNIEANSVENAAHKPSNLRGRWKRNSTSGTATIKENNSKLPKEINTVKLENAERLDRPNSDKKRENNNNKRFEKKACNCKQNKCCCCSFFCKIKNFVLALFGFKTQKCEKKHEHNSNRGRRPYGNRKRNYHSRPRNSQSR